LLRQPHAFRGISTVIDSGKKRQPRPSPTRGGKVASGSNGSTAIFHHKIVEEQSSKKQRCPSWGTEEARLRESEKFRKYAADCIRIASQMNGKDRQALLEIADAWETRAQDAEKKEESLRS
jgi:hypothetical protein